MNLILETGVGSWDPAVFLAGFLILLLLSHLIWSRGDASYSKGVQEEAFFSGELPPGDGIAAKNMYWGFTEALKKYYSWAINLHTGIVNDYIAWFIALMAIILVLTTI